MLDEAIIQGMALRLDGKALAKAVEIRLQAQIESHLPRVGRPPGLAVLRVGDDPASAVYVANKEKACARIGVASYGAHLPSSTPFAEVLSTIQQLNADPRVDQHWNGGAMGGRRATALIQRKQVVASQPWRIELPPSCLVICRGRQKIEALIKPSQLIDQPGAMGPWTAASNN